MGQYCRLSFEAVRRSRERPPNRCCDSLYRRVLTLNSSASVVASETGAPTPKLTFSLEAARHDSSDSTTAGPRPSKPATRQVKRVAELNSSSGGAWVSHARLGGGEDERELEAGPIYGPRGQQGALFLLHRKCPCSFVP